MQYPKVANQNTRRYRDASDLTGKPPLREFVEIEIPMPWGHLAGKWYGPLDIRPVLGLHGWLDNAGTFDFIATLFPSNMAFLSLDLPGHGLSSPLPPGCVYHLLDIVYLLRLIMQHFKWEKLAFIAHSMSAGACFLFSSIYPNLVEMLICIDSIRPQSLPTHSLIGRVRYNIEGVVREVQRSSEPPNYDLDEMIERLHEGSFQSVSKERALHILVRNIEKSAEDRFKFARDNRYKFYNYLIGSLNLYEEMARNISSPALLIRALGSPFYPLMNETDPVYRMVVSKDNFTIIERRGTHHLHFNDPESIIEPVMQFLQAHARESFKTVLNSSGNIMLAKL